MFYRIIDEDIKVYLTLPAFSDELFKLTENNRYFLKEWLPWLDYIKTADDTKKFINIQLERFAKGEAIHQTIFYKGKIVGVLAFNSIKNNTGIIGYWLAEEYNNMGIMTKCVKDFIEQGFIYFNLEKIEIHCASNNIKSQQIPKRIGLKEERIIKNAEKLNGKYHDHIVYSITKNS